MCLLRVETPIQRSARHTRQQRVNVYQSMRKPKLLNNRMDKKSNQQLIRRRDQSYNSKKGEVPFLITLEMKGEEEA